MRSASGLMSVRSGSNVAGMGAALRGMTLLGCGGGLRGLSGLILTLLSTREQTKSNLHCMITDVCNVTINWDNNRIRSDEGLTLETSALPFYITVV